MSKKDKSVRQQKKIRTAVVGCGSIGQIMHLPHVTELSDTFELVGICDISPGVLEHCGRRFHVSPEARFTSVQTMLDKTEPEAVIVCDLLHSDPAIAALKAGCHVLVEKPMAHSLQECDEMLNLQAKSGKTLMVAYMKRFDPGYEYAQARVAKLKDVFHVRAHDFVGPNASFTGDIHDVKTFNDVKDQTTRKLISERMKRAIGTDGDDASYLYMMLLYLCTHDLTILRGMFGSPKAITGALFSPKGRCFHAIMDYGENMTGVFEFGEFNLKKFDEELAIYSKTEVVKVQFPSPFVPFAMTEVEVWEPEGPGKEQRPDRPHLPAGPAGQGLKISKVHASYDESFRRELQHFAHCVRTGEKPRTTAEDGREDVRLCIEMANKALRG
ncbi:MAG TPA: Gfo/Idh/MocA family oxidoreductase [Planctomycetota bacterium]|nr:Gfo/Idh/MocA family oxidoreductase [Planctomycetota bacterium]